MDEIIWHLKEFFVNLEWFKHDQYEELEKSFYIIPIYAHPEINLHIIYLHDVI